MTAAHRFNPCAGRRRGRLAAAAVAAAFSFGSAVAADAPPEPSGYRMDGYRSPTPATLAGANVLDTPAAEKVWRAKVAIFVDTMPRPEKPAGLPAATIWRDVRRSNIPGSIWLANTGHGALSADRERYFRDGLAALTGGDRSTPLAFYCQAACWMSWNAAKRAVALGYSDVAWYPDGTDGWSAAGLPLEAGEPYAAP